MNKFYEKNIHITVGPLALLMMIKNVISKYVNCSILQIDLNKTSL